MIEQQVVEVHDVAHDDHEDGQARERHRELHIGNNVRAFASLHKAE